MYPIASIHNYLNIKINIFSTKIVGFVSLDTLSLKWHRHHKTCVNILFHFALVSYNASTMHVKWTPWYYIVALK